MMDRENLEKGSKPQILRGPDLLKLLPPQTKIFDNVSSSSSQSSELSGPFSDVVYTVEMESKRKAKELYGKDLYTAFSFSPEFKTAIEQLKREMLAENPDYLKTFSTADEDLTEKKAEPELDEKKEDENAEDNDFLLIPGIDYEIEAKEEEEEEDVEEKKKEKESGKDKKKKRIWLDDDESFFDTMSNYWRMLSVFDEFKISPPWYDAYAEGKKHWLQTDPIPAEVFENSRKKCENWLSKYFNK